VFYGSKKDFGYLLEQCFGDLQRLIDARKRDRSDKIFVTFDKGFKVVGICRLSDEVGNVDGVEVARCEKAFDGLQVDVIRVAEVRLRPVELCHRRIGRGTCGGRFGADDGMLAV
jgi:hypothetical protein